MGTTAADWERRHREAGRAAPEPPLGWAELGRSLPAGGRALDVACGRGATAVWCALGGVDTVALDRSATAVDLTAALAAAHHVSELVHASVHDLDAGLPPDLGRFDLVVCQRYRDVTLVPALLGALAPSGIALLTVLSAVDVAEPGAHHAPRRELADAVAAFDVEVLLDREGGGLATVAALRRSDRPVDRAPRRSSP